MAHLDYCRQRKLKVYAICLLMLVALFAFSGCNASNNTVNLANGVQEPTHFMAKFLMVLNDGVGNFGWTVVAFTVILKVILSPFDFWQKHITRKNAKIMARMKPRLDDIKAKCGDDKARYNQEQMALYKKEKYSTFGACLPTLITLVVFIVVFSGFSQMVAYQNGLVYQNAQTTFNTTYAEKNDELYTAYYDDLSELEQAQSEKIAEIEALAHYNAIDLAQTAVAENYEMPSFLWVNNIFVQDTWKNAVPDYQTFSGQSGFAQAKVEGVTIDEYQTVMGKVLGTGGYGSNGSWNGLLILPLLSIVLNFVSQKLTMKAQGPQPTAEGAGGMASSKMMQYMMPVLMGVFALMYSAAFTTYIFVGAVYTIVFQLAYNLFASVVDKKKLSTVSSRRIN
ncbi:MAG: membrane protein insertase YidC [Clostridia bacterium]|nr:membrane protein insertase YidC [Clostridia bacterium]